MSTSVPALDESSSNATATATATAIAPNKTHSKTVSHNGHTFAETKTQSNSWPVLLRIAKVVAITLISTALGAITLSAIAFGAIPVAAGAGLVAGIGACILLTQNPKKKPKVDLPAIPPYVEPIKEEAEAAAAAETNPGPQPTETVLRLEKLEQKNKEVDELRKKEQKEFDIAKKNLEETVEKLQKEIEESKTKPEATKKQSNSKSRFRKKSQSSKSKKSHRRSTSEIKKLQAEKEELLSQVTRLTEELSAARDQIDDANKYADNYDHLKDEHELLIGRYDDIKSLYKKTLDLPN